MGGGGGGVRPRARTQLVPPQDYLIIRLFIPRNGLFVALVAP